MAERGMDAGKGAVNRDQEIKRSTAVTEPGETSVTEHHEVSMDPANFGADGGDLSVESLEGALDKDAKNISHSEEEKTSVGESGGDVVKNPSLKH